MGEAEIGRPNQIHRMDCWRPTPTRNVFGRAAGQATETSREGDGEMKRSGRSPRDFLPVTKELSGELLIRFCGQPHCRVSAFFHGTRCSGSTHISADPTRAH